jgi:hypothetical protein
MFSSRKKDEDKDKDGSRGSVAKKRAEREAINQKLTRLMVRAFPATAFVFVFNLYQLFQLIDITARSTNRGD